jgi:hypothetical protein
VAWVPDLHWQVEITEAILQNLHHDYSEVDTATAIIAAIETMRPPLDSDPGRE